MRTVELQLAGLDSMLKLGWAHCLGVAPALDQIATLLGQQMALRIRFDALRDRHQAQFTR